MAPGRPTPAHGPRRRLQLSQRRLAGTTLIEVLVVMVVFLVGILAVVQIFPKGFQILVLTRNSSMATALSRDEVERLKATPDQLPEAILALNLDGSIDSATSPMGLGPMGDSLAKDGTLSLGSTPVGPWARFTGPNRFRYVVGESHPLSAPRQVGADGSSMFGSLVIAKFGPVDSAASAPIRFYGNDLNVFKGEWDGQSGRGEYDAFLTRSDASAVLQVPAHAVVSTYRVSFTAFVNNAGTIQRRSFIGMQASVGGATRATTADLYPLNSVFLASLIPGSAGTLVSVDQGSIRVQREFLVVGSNAAWSVEDPYQVKLLNSALGAFLFHPAAYTSRVERGDEIETLSARMDYNVYDWRVLREEFRFPYNLPADHQLAVGSILTSNVTGADGRPDAQGISILEGELAPTLLYDANNHRADHFVLQDMATGGVYIEQAPGAPTTSNNPVIRVNKSTGVVSVRDTDDDASNGTTVPLLMLDGTVRTVQLDGRAVRAMYMTKDNFAVQVIKSPSLYTSAYSRPVAGEYYVGGSGSIGGGNTRVYFPASDAGRKVTVGELSYRRTGDTQPRQIFGQDFVIQAGSAADPVGLPYIDIRSADSDAESIDITGTGLSNGYGLRDVKAASLAVRTVWNPDGFTLGEDGTANLRRLEQWLQSTRRSTIETYLEQGSLAQ